MLVTRTTYNNSVHPISCYTVIIHVNVKLNANLNDVIKSHCLNTSALAI